MIQGFPEFRMYERTLLYAPGVEKYSPGELFREMISASKAIHRLALVGYTPNYYQ